MSVLAELLSPFWPYILTAIIGAAGLFGVRRSGVKAQKAKQDKARMKTMKQASEVEDEVAAKSDSAVRRDLGRWVRKE